MKRLAIPILLLAIIAAGCASVRPDTKLPPLVYIDSVSSADINVGDNIKFSGHAISTTGEVVAYSWRSSINGNLSTAASFETKTLLAGAHTVWFKAQDNYGNWSNEIGTSVNVRAIGGPTLMQINEFSASPPNIRQGQWSTLNWDISGTGTVSILPDIGDVASIGSRSVKPMSDTVYTIYAKNEAGQATATAKVMVTILPITTLKLYSITAEDGTVRKDRVVLDQVNVGENDLQVQMQGFLSFDISNIPPGAVITDTSLDLTSINVVGAPFPYQGSLNIYNQQFGSTLKSSHYTTIVPSGFLYSWNYNSMSNMVPDHNLTSANMIDAVQKQVDAGNSRFQLRLQFEKYYYYPQANYSYVGKVDPYIEKNNYLNISTGNPNLIVKYVIPE